MNALQCKLTSQASAVISESRSLYFLIDQVVNVMEKKWPNKRLAVHIFLVLLCKLKILEIMQ